jgi:hypothetical protein
MSVWSVQVAAVQAATILRIVVAVVAAVKLCSKLFI